MKIAQNDEVLKLMKSAIIEWIAQAEEQDILNIIFILNKGEISIKEIKKNYNKLVTEKRKDDAIKKETK